MGALEIDSHNDQQTDRALVDAFLRTRAESAFRALYRRHTRALYRMAYRLVGQEQAEDVVQETWCRAAQKLDSFEWRSALLTWLTGILVRCCRETWREGAKLVSFPAQEEFKEPVVLSSSWLMLDVERALASLPPRSREVLVLHDIEGFTHDEVARALGIVPGTSKSQLARGRRALRLCLEQPVSAPANGEKAS